MKACKKCGQPVKKNCHDYCSHSCANSITSKGRPSTKKRTKVLVKAEATDKFPAQTEVYHEDVLVGHWETIRQTGAIPAATKNEYLARLAKLRDAIKVAKEEANSIQVQAVQLGAKLFESVFGKMK